MSRRDVAGRHRHVSGLGNTEARRRASRGASYALAPRHIMSAYPPARAQLPFDPSSYNHRYLISIPRPSPASSRRTASKSSSISMDTPRERATRYLLSAPRRCSCSTWASPAPWGLTSSTTSSLTE